MSDAPRGTATLATPVTGSSVLALAGFGVGFRDRVVLAEVSFEVLPRTVCVVLGPAGGGKSTLLRTLAGLNHGQPDVRLWGDARYRGAPLGPGNQPAIVHQDVRHVVSTVRENLYSALPQRSSLSRGEQRDRITALIDACGIGELAEHLDDEAVTLPSPLRKALAAVRAMATGAELVCLDETTVGLDPGWTDRLLGLMRWYAQTHAVLFVTHHQAQARAVADQCVLLAGGRVQEDAPARQFFDAPGSTVTRHFLDTGSVSLPSPDADPETLADDAPRPPPLPPQARPVPDANTGPRGFRWLLPGKLGGTPRPGIVASLSEDLQALERLGVTVLVTLEEQPTVPAAALEAHRITPIHFPVADMAAPPAVAAGELCRRLEALLAGGEVVVLHCRAGQGRTGTLLACLLIWDGAGAVEALERVRGVNAKWVTSAEQVEFLETFSQYVRWQRGPTTDGPHPARSGSHPERRG